VTANTTGTKKDSWGFGQNLAAFPVTELQLTTAERQSCTVRA